MSPGISVIICCYNSAGRLPETLKHLAAQQVPSDIYWEIVLVDNASTDETALVAEKLWKEVSASLNFRIVSEPKPGLINARFKGMTEAHYSYLLYCDDDNWLSPGYIATAHSILAANPQIGVLGGCGIFEPEQPAWNEVYNFESSYVNGSQTWAAEQHWVYGAGAIYKKDVLKQFYQQSWQPVTQGRTGKKMSSGEDVEICYMFHLAGFEIKADDRLKFQHFVPLNRQNFSYIYQLNYGHAYAEVLLNSYRLLPNNTSGSFIKQNNKWLISLVVRYLKFLIILLMQFLKSLKGPGIKQRIILNQLAGSISCLIFNKSKLVKHFNHLQSLINSPGFKNIKPTALAIF